VGSLDRDAERERAMTATPWWTGLSPAQATIDCGGQRHQLRWEAGELRALDHDDPAAERTLAAIGGEPYACIDQLDAWTRHATDLRVLVLASRGPADLLSTLREQPGHAAARPAPLRRGRASYSSVRSMRATAVMSTGRGWAFPAAHPPDDPDAQLLELLALGGGLSHRLAVTVAAEWARRCDRPDAEVSRAGPQLQAALYGRVASGMRTWLGQPALAVELTMIEPGAEPSLRERDGVILADLPFRWLAEVWARDLATVAGRFCVAATGSGNRWTLSTVGPDLAEPQPVVVELRPGD
jgi:hypothetical protein